MKIYNIIGSIAATFMAIAMISCAEDKVYDLGGTEFGKVSFEAVNLALPDSIDSAMSSQFSDYYYYDRRDLHLAVTVYDPYYYNETGMLSSIFSIFIDKESEIWSGGYNDIQLTFKPSFPNEKSATFTMPDGSTFTATSENPTIIWTPDSALRNSNGNNYIKAESNYTIGNAVYKNAGYIYVNFNPDLRYNKADKKWYISPWLDGQELTAAAYTKFTAKNLTIVGQDSCISYNHRFPDTKISWTNTFSIPYIGSGGTEHIEEITNITSYDLYACGYNDILFTFLPTENEKELTLTLPDYSQIILTAENPTAVWHATYEDIINYNNSWIYGQSSFAKDGIIYKGEGEIRLNSIRNIYYDEATGVFRSEYYY